MKKELLNGLTDDQIAKVKACENPGDLLQLAKDEGVELNEEQLTAVSGGACSSDKKTNKCPKCGSTKIVQFNGDESSNARYKCTKCGHVFR